MAMQLRRGTNAQRLAMTPLIGELIFVTDYVSANVPALWIGDGTTVGGVVAASQSLDNLTDVTITTPNEGQTLYYDATDSQWKNTSILEVNDVSNRIEVAGNIQATGDLTLNSDGGPNDVIITFTGGRTLKWDHGDQRFEFASGNLYVNGNVTIPATYGLNVDNNTLVVDAANNRVGVNVAAPNFALDVFGNSYIAGNLTLSGDLTVNGSTTTVNSTTLTVDDKNIELAATATPSDTTADGGGITLKGSTDKKIFWQNSDSRWYFNNGDANNYRIPVNLDDLADVTTSSPNKGQLLYYDGSGWVNSNLIQFDNMVYRPRFQNNNSATPGSIQSALLAVKNTGSSSYTSGDGSGILIGVVDNTDPTPSVFAGLSAVYNSGGGHQIRLRTSSNNFSTENILLSVDNEDLKLKGTELVFNAEGTGSAAVDAQITVERGTSSVSDAYIKWNEDPTTPSNSRWEISDDLYAPRATFGTVDVGRTNGQIDTNGGYNLTLDSDGGNVLINDNLNVDSGVLFVDAANNRVGINTVAPTAGYGLDVNDNARVNGSLFVTGSTTLGNAPTVDVLSVDSVSYFNGHVYMYQNVQIGDASADTLTVNATSQFNNNVTLGSSSTDTLTVNATPTFSADATFNGNVNVGSDSSDTLTVTATANFNNNVTLGSSSADTLTVNATSAFNNNVTLGSSSADTVTVNGELTTSIAFKDVTGSAHGIRGTVGTSDSWFVGGYATTSTGGADGQLIIATADDGTEPIYVRQYTGTILSGTVTNQLTLLDGSGDTSIPNNLTVGANVSCSQVTVDALTTFNTESTSNIAAGATQNISSTSRISQKVVIKITEDTTGEIHMLEALAFRKGTTAYLTTYAEMYTNTALATFTADVSGGNVRILATSLSANTIDVSVARISLD